jgi:ATP-dependent DNA helicase RecQ
LTDSAGRARTLLQTALGSEAGFRQGQLEAIEALVEHQKRVLVVQATGWGKSVVYFIATKLLRDEGAGPTVLISPLLSLMRDQLRMAQRIGVRALSLTSANREDWPAIKRALANDACDILLVSPERLGNEEFQTGIVPLFRPGIGLFVVDEAHCISDWGHDFRPDYRRIVRVVHQLPPTVPVLATTATANDRVVADVSAQLGPGLETLRGPLARRSLRLQSIVLADQAERLAWLLRHLADLPGSGIIYCLTVADSLRVATWLRQNGLDARAYFADLPTEEKEELERRLLANEIKALVATVALGMGFDKPDLGFVVHFQRPGSLIAYYQQIGRAGRALDDAVAVLLNGREDDEIHDYFVSTAFPGQEMLVDVLAVIEDEPGIRARSIEQQIDVKRTKLDQALKFLEIDQAIYRENGRYFRTPTPWVPDGAAWTDVTERREGELAEIRVFSTSTSCLMESVTRALDDPHAERCGRCANCAGAVVGADVEYDDVLRAVEFLRRAHRRIESRKQWPHGVGPGHTTIPADERSEEGRALSIWGDAGWGSVVRDAKYQHHVFGDDLVDATAEMIRRWHPQPMPEWVTSVPSLRHPQLVVDLTDRLAGRLGLPFDPVLVKSRSTPPQKTLQNSSHQAANVFGAFDIGVLRIRGPVLLVDDIVDSRWTFTECARVLRRAGVVAVFPVALAEAGPSWQGEA